MERRESILLVLSLANGEPLSPVKLQKTLFLFGKLLPPELLPPDYYDFAPFDYGPFCGAIYDEARLLASEGLLYIDSSPIRRYPEYIATPLGLMRGQSVAESLPEEAVSYATRIVSWVLRQTFASLVSAIYQKYPEYKVKSIFREL